MKRSLILVVVLFPLFGLAALLHTARLQASPPLPSSGGGVTFTVNSTLDATDVNPGDGVCETAVGNGECTLRAAVQESNILPNANTIFLPTGMYTLTISGINEDLSATGDLDVIGELAVVGMGSPIVDGNQLDRVFHILDGAEVTIADITVQHGRTSNAGGGIYSNGNLTLTASTLFSNTTTNANGFGGGGIANGGVFISMDSTLEQNFASGFGGAIGTIGIVTFTNVIIVNNIAMHEGGGIYNEEPGSMSITGGYISHNHAGTPLNDVDGGGVYNRGGYITVNDVDISHNSSCEGGGISQHNNNNYATLVIKNSHIYENTSCRSGGGITSWGNSLTIENSSISHNVARDEGGGIKNGGFLTITDSIINNNTVSFTGGGIYNDVRSVSGPSTLLVNVTVSQNSSNRGGGIVNSNGNIIVYNSTIVSNTATPPNAGGFFASTFNSVILKNTIVAHNSQNNCNRILFSAGNNLDSGNSCGFNSSGDITNTVPLLGPLQDNGGSTLTHALLQNSPAIDAADDEACPETDQRGVPRPFGEHCDIGAYEYNPVLTANDDVALTPFNTPLLIDVLANDLPGENGDPSLESVGEPMSGTAVITDSLVLYTPNLDFTGTDTFSYTITDGMVTDTAVVTVTVQPLVAPTAVDDAAQTQEVEPILINVLANDLPGSSGDPTLASVGEPENGTAVISGTFILYTPAPDFFGTDTFTYTITDGVLTDTAVVTVTVLPIDDQTTIYLPVVLKPEE